MGIKCSTIFFWLFLLALVFYFLLFSLLFHSWSSGALSPSDLSPWKGRLTLLRRAHQTFWCSRAVESPVLGTVDPRANFAQGKTAPQSGLLESHARVQQVVLFQDDPQAPSGVAAVLFLFSERTLPLLPQSTSGFPLPEKNPKIHGVLASQDSVPQGGVKAALRKTSGIELEVIDLRIITHVVPGK